MTVTSHSVLSIECCMFVKDIHSSVWQADQQWVPVDEGKVSESTVVHAGNVWNVWTYRQRARCSTGN